MLLSPDTRSINNCDEVSRLLALTSNIPTFVLNIWTANKSDFKKPAYNKTTKKERKKEPEV